MDCYSKLLISSFLVGIRPSSRFPVKKWVISRPKKLHAVSNMRLHLIGNHVILGDKLFDGFKLSVSSFILASFLLKSDGPIPLNFRPILFGDRLILSFWFWFFRVLGIHLEGKMVHNHILLFFVFNYLTFECIGLFWS